MAKQMAATKKDTGLKKMPTQEASSIGKATIKDTRDLDTCPNRFRRCAIIWEIG